jgi:hypothetical protein
MNTVQALRGKSLGERARPQPREIAVQSGAAPGGLCPKKKRPKVLICCASSGSAQKVNNAPNMVVGYFEKSWAEDDLQDESDDTIVVDVVCAPNDREDRANPLRPQWEFVYQLRHRPSA